MSKKDIAVKTVVGGAALAVGSASAADAQDINGLYGGLSASLPVSGELDFGFEAYDYEGSAQAGIFAGYNMVRGDWVFGGEINFMAGEHGLDVPISSYSGIGIEDLVDLKVRGGRMMGNTLVYGVLGYSTGDIGFGSVVSGDVDGVSVGVGIEHGIGSNGFIGGEVLRRNLDVGGDFSLKSGITETDLTTDS